MFSIGPPSGCSAWCQPVRSTRLGMRWKQLVLQGIDRQHVIRTVVEPRPFAAKRGSGVIAAAGLDTGSAPHLEWEEQGSRALPRALPLDAQVGNSLLHATMAWDKICAPARRPALRTAVWHPPCAPSTLRPCLPRSCWTSTRLSFVTSGRSSWRLRVALPPRRPSLPSSQRPPPAGRHRFCLMIPGPRRHPLRQSHLMQSRD